MSGIKQFFGAAIAALVLGGAVQAATVSEGDIAGGEYSSNWAAPTAIDAGVTSLMGSGAGNAYDILSFTGLPTGAQTLTLNFSAPDGIGYSYSAGGAIRISPEPFRWSWDGQDAGAFNLNYWQPGQTVEVSLDDSFGGDLYLGLYFTHGSGISYNAALPTAVSSVAPVPVPAAGLLLGSLIAALGLGAAVRQRKRA